MPVAVVTGASRGLGNALAHALAGRRWRLALDARHEEVLTSAAPVAALVVPGVVTDPDHRAVLAARAAELGAPTCS